MLTFENINKEVNYLSTQLNTQYNCFKNIKSIIVCGNGLNGYNTNSAKFIDSHDLTIRINNYETISNMTGEKTDILFAGASTDKHLTPDQFYPEISKFKTIISIYSIINKLKSCNKISLTHQLILYPINHVIKSTKNLGYKSHTGISGIHCSLLMLAICQKFNIPIINFIGFNTNSIQDADKQTYYYGERNTNNTSHLEHDWTFHAQFFNIIYNHFPSNL